MKYPFTLTTFLPASMVFAFAIGGHTSAFAQDSDASEQTEFNKTLEEIVVTATRREESIQEVPVSITQISGDSLEKAGLQNLNDIAGFVPNFHLSSSNQENNARITIRGVGSVGNTAIEGSVGVFVDGVYYARPGSILGNMNALQSVEVLRGPQGTLFGRNTPMGVVNIKTLNPSESLEAKASFTVGNYNTLEAFGYISGGLTDSLSANLSINTSSSDGVGFNEFTQSDFGDRNDLSIRSKLLFDISDATQLKIGLDYSKLENEGPIVEILEETNTPLFIGTTQALFGAAAGTESSFDRRVNQLNEDDISDEQYGISMELTHTFDNEFEFKSITALRSWESDVENEGTLRLPADLLPRNSFYEHEAVSQEFQLLSPDSDSYEYVLGAFFYQEDYTIKQNFDAGVQFCIPVAFAVIRQQLLAAGLPIGLATQTAQAQAGACARSAQFAGVESDFSQDLTSYALFYHGTHYLTDQLKLSLGARYSDDDKEGSFEQVLNNPFFALVRAPESAPNLEFSDSEFTYLANLSYQVNDNHMLFGTVSTGFKSGGFNSQGGLISLAESRVFDSETTKNYELGYKGTLFDDRIQLNATLFRTEIEDFQDRSFDGLSFVTTNAGELRQQGIEIDMRSTITDNLSVMAGFGYLDSEFLDYPAASPLPGQLGTQNLTGQRNHRAPKIQASLLVDYTRNFGDNYSWFIRPSWSYIDEQNLGGDTNQNPQTLQPAYSIVNLRMGITNENSGWSIEAFVNNATDEEYCTGMFNQPLGDQIGAVNRANNTSVIRCVVGDPRMYGIKVNYQY